MLRTLENTILMQKLDQTFIKPSKFLGKYFVNIFYLGKFALAKNLHGTVVIGHARWLATAGGYLRLKLFDIHDLSSQQQASLDQVVQFIVDANVPSFFEIFFKPTAIE